MKSKEKLCKQQKLPDLEVRQLLLLDPANLYRIRRIFSRLMIFAVLLRSHAGFF